MAIWTHSYLIMAYSLLRQIFSEVRSALWWTIFILCSTVKRSIWHWSSIPCYFISLLTTQFCSQVKWTVIKVQHYMLLLFVFIQKSKKLPFNSRQFSVWCYVFSSLCRDFPGIFFQILNLSLFRHSTHKSKVKVKQSHYRPGQALSVPVGWGSQISRQSALVGGKVVSLTHRPPLPPRKYSWYSFLLEADSTPGP